MLKNYGKSLLSILINVVVLTIITTVFQYFEIIKGDVLSVFKIIIPIISILIGSFILGRNSNKLGYVEGLKLGGIVVLIFLIIGYLILRKTFKPIVILYYVIILICSMLGSMIGINTKKKN